MKPLLSGTYDSDHLQDLGRASVQIVHDLKNQLNGLKLYATFLRKRIEKSERPADEQETITKLISGLERAASDLSAIVQYGKPLELRKQPDVDVQKLMQSVCASLGDICRTTGGLTGSIALEFETAECCGAFDPAMLSDALKAISLGALKMSEFQTPSNPVVARFRKSAGTAPSVTIEWPGVNHSDHDPFRSFAGSHELRMSLAAKIVEAHGGSAESRDNCLIVTLPLSA
jgi:signal transduction histidine kinase